ncbi:hypothetical protein PPERSA_00336 [Pseudocohnilembus persalinus]|uniref:EF-hand domain-containing protein n=1 Tax=Pseudocohnilembus persalinus TaxID=266149 RepID=A0A0V0QY46_PSEPJ|nr:hypothetical protein PPERSA_00336 [Pseudocohnilembus persalinus]|eukprot:KRX07179.1 hypothetical protein PPERSA_00336 [Pseudocohnilembus persalinus]
MLVDKQMQDFLKPQKNNFFHQSYNINTNNSNNLNDLCSQSHYRPYRSYYTGGQRHEQQSPVKMQKIFKPRNSNLIQTFEKDDCNFYDNDNDDDKCYVIDYAFIDKLTLSDPRLQGAYAEELLNNPNLDIEFLIEQDPDYFHHIFGNCACAKCTCKKCKCRHNKPRLSYKSGYNTAYSLDFSQKSGGTQNSQYKTPALNQTHYNNLYLIKVKLNDKFRNDYDPNWKFKAPQHKSTVNSRVNFKTNYSTDFKKGQNGKYYEYENVARNFTKTENTEHEIHLYDKKWVVEIPHFKDQYECQSTINFLTDNNIYASLVPSLQLNKEPDENHGIQKRRFRIYNLDHENQLCIELAEYKIEPYEVPQMYTPWDFDGKRILILEYLKYPPTKNIIRGEYENKIRRHSPPEKIFEVFASQAGDDHKLYMSHYDLFKAICPFNYSTKEISDEEQKDFSSTNLSNFADIDGDGMISLYEYYLVVCLIQANRDDIKQWFREKNQEKDPKLQDTITKEQLIQFYNQLQQKSKTKLTITKMPDPRKVQLTKQEFEETVKKLTEKLFKERQNNILPLKEFLKMREDLLKDILKYEFNSFPHNSKGNITGEDFAKSLISFLDVNQVKKYLKLLEDVKFNGEINFTDYYVFQKFLQDNMNSLNQVIEEKGVITRKKLKKLIESYHQKLQLKSNPDQIDIFIKILDIDRSGKIEPQEFCGIVTNRAFYGSGDSDNSLAIPFVGLKEQFIKWLHKGERIWEIIKE